jgi:hypothetical protein
MHRRPARDERLVPPRARLRPNLEGAQLAARMRALRSVLGPIHLPPPVVPLRASVVDTDRGQRLFLELRNLSGCFLDGIGVEAVTFDENQLEVDVMVASLSELSIAGDPRRIVPVGGWALDPEKPASGAIITVLYATFSDGSTWDGTLATLEDPRVSESARAFARERFFSPYRQFLRVAEDAASSTAAN